MVSPSLRASSRSCRDEHDGLVQLRLESQQQVLHAGADERVERAESLVHEEDFGIGGQGARQAHPLLHAAGELSRVVILEPLQTHLLDPIPWPCGGRPPC